MRGAVRSDTLLARGELVTRGRCASRSAAPRAGASRRLRVVAAAEPAASSAARVESAKAAVLAAVAGSVAAAPVSWLLPALIPELGMAPPLSAPWEFDLDMVRAGRGRTREPVSRHLTLAPLSQLAASLGLFGLVYRYAARDDGSPRLKQGLVGAFVAVRALAHITPSAACSPVPLVCGPPLIYFDWAMLSQAVATAAPAGVAFVAAALALEAAGDAGLVQRATNGGADL